MDGPSCVDGLDCVSTVLCTAGPCPGTCLAPCDEELDCSDGESCAAPEGWDEQERYCVSSQG
jgi:hypothetical protein